MELGSQVVARGKSSTWFSLKAYKQSILLYFVVVAEAQGYSTGGELVESTTRFNRMPVF